MSELPGPAWPSVSVTMLTHHSIATSPAALRSVLDNDYPGRLEILVREQGGDDAEYAALTAEAGDDDRVVIERGSNLGFCEGHERLVGSSTGEIVVLLNDDARLEPGYLRHVAVAFGDPEVGSVQGMLVAGLGPTGEATTIDTTGLVVARSRSVRARSRGRSPAEARLAPREVWGVDGAVLALRRAAIDDARLPDGRLFPAEFGAYMEDVELAWRLRRLGWRAVYVADAVAAHARGTVEHDDGIRARIARRRERDLQAHVGGFVNLRLTQLRHEQPRRLLGDLPWWLPREIAAWAALVAVTPGAVGPVVRRLARGVGPSLRARRTEARRRRVVDDDRWLR